MEDNELKDLLREYNNKLEESRVLNLQSWALNYKCFVDIQTGKAKSKLAGLLAIKIVAVILGIGWILFLGLMVYGNQLKNIYFTVSVVMVMLFTGLAVAVYIQHIILLKQVNYGESITGAQKKLATLQVSTVKIIRIIFLQMPFYTTWFWSTQWILSGVSFWLISFPITIVFTMLAIWLYKNISLKNIGTRKARWLMSGPEFNYIIKAKNFLDEIEEFKKDLLPSKEY